MGLRVRSPNGGVLAPALPGPNPQGRDEVSQTCIEDGVSRLALTSKDGTVRGWAVVDPEDVERLGRTTWSLSQQGYGVRSASRPDGEAETLLLHRAVLDLPAYGAPRVRHVNGDRLDCRRKNLAVSPEWFVRLKAGSPEWAKAGLLEFIRARLAEVGVCAGVSIRA